MLILSRNIWFTMYFIIVEIHYICVHHYTEVQHSSPQQCESYECCSPTGEASVMCSLASNHMLMFAITSCGRCQCYHFIALIEAANNTLRYAKSL